MRILITGATGLIGREIGKALAQKGHEIYVVSRDITKAKEALPFPCQIIHGDLAQKPLEKHQIDKIEGVINLMGESVVGRWNSEKKAKIYQSRVVGTRNLVESLPASLQFFISGSAIGFYGDGGDSVFAEDHPAGKDYLAKVCCDWEGEALKAPGRKVVVRTGVVLAPHGGAFEEMLFPFRAGVGGAIGDGKHWMSWIHLGDIVGIFVTAVENTAMSGIFNGVSPLPVRNSELSEQLARALDKNLGPSIPRIALQGVFGEGADVLLASIRASAEKVTSLGFEFQYTDINKTFEELCEPYRKGEDVYYGEQYIPFPPEKVFPFFKDPYNLEKITPQSLSFHIDKVSTSQIEQGTLIDYKLKIHGVPVRWKTEIDQWKPPFKFVDKQLLGPYSFWHHTHEFKPFCGGTLMTDRVLFRLPMGYLGWIVAGKLVRKDVETIFNYRRKCVANMDLFGS